MGACVLGSVIWAVLIAALKTSGFVRVSAVRTAIGGQYIAASVCKTSAFTQFSKQDFSSKSDRNLENWFFYRCLLHSFMFLTQILNLPRLLYCKYYAWQSLPCVLSYFGAMKMMEDHRKQSSKGEKKQKRRDRREYINIPQKILTPLRRTIPRHRFLRLV